MITNDAKCAREIESKTDMAKTTFSKKQALFTSKLNVHLRKKLVKCFIWSTALCGAETGILWKRDDEITGKF